MVARLSPDCGVSVERRGAVTVVRMERGENRFHPDLLAGLHAVLDDLVGPAGRPTDDSAGGESSEEPAALVLTGTGKFFSNGLDLEFLATHPKEGHDAVDELLRLFARLLGLDLFTVAAVNGHAFGGGAMLALAFDAAVMRADRGYFCLPEADLGMPFMPAMASLIQARLTPAVAHRAMVTSHRYPANEAVEAGIVSESAEEQQVVDRAVELAAAQAGKPRRGLGAIKRSLYRDLIAELHPRS